MPENGGRKLAIFQLLKMINLTSQNQNTFNSTYMEKMNLEEMKDLVLNYVIKEYLEDEDVKITYDTPLISSGYVDSFSMVSLLVFIENKFKIKIPPSNATPEAFDSVNKIVALAVKYM
jgi:D-alanine--poly(phosphoribitol) ligase subunit 2